MTYGYDKDANLVSTTNGNGTRTAYSYNADGEVVSITHAAPGGTVNSFDNYTYNSVGNVLTDTSQDGAWTYTYDANGRLIDAVFTSSVPAVLPNQNLQYSYDANGNRLSETDNGVTTNYVVNDMNEYTSVTSPSGTTNFTYDNNGNLISAAGPGGTTTYSYNELNQLIGVASPANTVAYTFNAMGWMTSTTVNGQTTEYMDDPGGSLVAEFDSSGSLVAHFTYGLGLVEQVGSSGAAAYYDFNAVGSTVGMTGSAGTYVNEYAYQPFAQRPPSRRTCPIRSPSSVPPESRTM